MALTLDQLEAEAAKLSPAERTALIDRLHELDESRDPEIEAAWDEEILRRSDDFDSGRVQGIPYEDAIARVKTKLGI